MAMPPQLRNAKRPKRSEPRPLAETLPHINVNDLDVPRNHRTYTSNISLRYPHLTGMKINWSMVQFFHSDPRPAFICECGRPVIKIYFKHQNLACRRCCNVVYGSQTRNKHSRPILKAI